MRWAGRCDQWEVGGGGRVGLVVHVEIHVHVHQGDDIGQDADAFPRTHVDEAQERNFFFFLRMTDFPRRRIAHSTHIPVGNFISFDMKLAFLY